VLYTGATFYGRLTIHGLNYKVEQGNSELVIPFTQVRVVANSAMEAYEKQRRAMKAPTVDEFVSLARWCQEQGLTDETRQLCRVVLKAEPGHANAIRLLKKGESSRSRIPSPTDLAWGAADPMVLTVAGISPGANADFIRRIQPLLINSCAQRGCHSADSDREFRLSAYRLSDGPRYRSSENLAEVLKRITLTAPEASPLLVSGRRAAHHKDVFAGPGGEECQQQLKGWILRVALEQSWIRQAGQVVPESSPAASAGVFTTKSGDQFKAGDPFKGGGKAE